ncbi:hypothetical protein CMV_006551 [Castanea mollissima]|uniref:Uncharacterized protein n=1 Tax=Castanea mollissima TaxID=60419 RepID=A0A8J4RAL2_9ROSI|nr:hypothetical protein CMV_006551 [Castanea mollissima]
MAENPKEMENPEEVKPHSAFLADFRAIHQELMDQEAKMAQAEAAAAEMAETLKLELVLPITNMQEAKALSKLHEEYEFKGSVELLHQVTEKEKRKKGKILEQLSLGVWKWKLFSVYASGKNMEACHAFCMNEGFRNFDYDWPDSSYAYRKRTGQVLQLCN